MTFDRTTPNRTGRIATAVIVLGVLLAACETTTTPSPSAAAPTAGTSLPASTAPSASEAPSQGSVPPAPSASAAAALCQPTDLAVSGGSLGGAAGSRGADVTVGSNAAGPCQLSAHAVVGVLDSSGRVLLQSKLPVTADGPTIQPGGSIAFSFLMGNWCDETARLPFRFQMTLATGSVDIAGTTMAAGDVPPCNGPGQPPTLSTSDWEPK